MSNTTNTTSLPAFEQETRHNHTFTVQATSLPSHGVRFMGFTPDEADRGAHASLSVHGVTKVSATSFDFTDDRDEVLDTCLTLELRRADGVPVQVHLWGVTAADLIAAVQSAGA